MKEMTLGECFRAILNHIVLVVFIPFLAVTVTAYVCWQVLPDTYTANTSMFVLQRSSDTALNSSDLSISTQLISDYRQLAESERVQSAAANLLGLKNLEDFEITVSSVNSTRIIDVSVESTDPVMAANVANAIASKLAECIYDVMNAENISIIDAASPPGKPSGPQSLRNCAIAGVAGLAFGVMLAIVIEMLHTTIKNRDTAEKLLGIPVLAAVPHYSVKGGKAKP